MAEPIFAVKRLGDRAPRKRLQRWRAVGDAASDLTELENEARAWRADSRVINYFYRQVVYELRSLIARSLIFFNLFFIKYIQTYLTLLDDSTFLSDDNIATEKAKLRLNIDALF